MVGQSRDKLVQMIRNTSKRDYKAVLLDFPRSRRMRGWSLEKVLRLAMNQPADLSNQVRTQSFKWLTIYDAFQDRGNKGKQSRPSIANKPVRKKAKKQVSRKNAAKKQVSRKKAAKRGGDLRAKRMKLSKLKMESVAEERANFGLIWKLRKLQLLNLYNHHFPDG